MLKDLFEQMQRQQHRKHQEHHQHTPTSASKGMSVYDAAALLGVSIDANITQVKSAYRKLMLKHHPDKGGSAEYAAKLNIARDVMMRHLSK